MKNNSQLKGLGTALITPFKTDGSVDYDALARLLDTQIKGFVDYIVVLGTTGEAATLTADEKKRYDSSSSTTSTPILSPPLKGGREGLSL